MPRRQKFRHVMSVIERRIRQGDYVLSPIPGERKIAEETGVSHMTARKAVRGLLDQKVLIRRPNGSLDIYPGFQANARIPYDNIRLNAGLDTGRTTSDNCFVINSPQDLRFNTTYNAAIGGWSSGSVKCRPS